ncbi:hypothetical protein ABHW52_03725, partial [Pediococcus pentosaceus]
STHKNIININPTNPILNIYLSSCMLLSNTADTILDGITGANPLVGVNILLVLAIFTILSSE